MLDNYVVHSYWFVGVNIAVVQFRIYAGLILCGMIAVWAGSIWQSALACLPGYCPLNMLFFRQLISLTHSCHWNCRSFLCISEFLNFGWRQWIFSNCFVSINLLSLYTCRFLTFLELNIPLLKFVRLCLQEPSRYSQRVSQFQLCRCWGRLNRVPIFAWLSMGLSLILFTLLCRFAVNLTWIYHAKLWNNLDWFVLVEIVHWSDSIFCACRL